MKRGHFDALRPVCPVCLERGRENPLTLGRVIEEAGEETGKEGGDNIRAGLLHCTEAACRAEFPIVDGLPVLVARLRAWVAENLGPLMARADLPDALESLFTDAAGPGTWLDTTRQHLSTYAWDAYGDLDPAEPAGPPHPGAAHRCLEASLALLDQPPAGPVLDLGCATGRTTFELAARGDGLVLGMDMNVSLLRLARRVLETGEAIYPRRRIGLVHDRRRFSARFAGAERVDFWIGDAQSPPFPAGRFGTVVAQNLLDCLGEPHRFLETLPRLLRRGGRALVSCPYDWSAAATPVEAWIGGHSQRGPDGGAAEPLLRALLTPGAHPLSVAGLRRIAEAPDVPWQARLHDRSIVHYRTHVVALERT